MKKLCLVMLLVLTIALLIACGAETTTTATTTEPPTTTVAPILPEGERLVKNTYTAVLNDAEWSTGSVNTSDFDHYGLASEVYQTLKQKYASYAVTYVIVKDGVETSYGTTKIFAAMSELGVCGVKMTVDEAAKTATAKIYGSEYKAQAAWKAVNAQAGSYIRFEFYSSLVNDYVVTVTPKKGGDQSTSKYTHDTSKVTSDGEKAVGIAQVTVPNDPGKTYYINLCLKTSGYPVLESIPLNVVTAKYDIPYQMIFKGEWWALNDERYFEEFMDLFGNVFPRLYARWGGTGKEPMTVTVLGRTNYDGVAYKSGTTVGFSIPYLNNGFRVGSFSHELTHIVQCYNYKYSDRAQLIPGHESVKKHWFTENMANYGRHRYYAYGYSTDLVSQRDVAASYKWNYSEYGESQLFFSWMDWAYPSKDLNGDGKVTTMEERGVIDYLVFMSKEWKGGKIDDDPFTPGTTFNNWVKEKTGFNTMDLLRQEYIRQSKAGEFVFKGFRDYKDNFVTENIPGVPNPEYPMHEELKPTAKTNPVLAAAVTTGDNLCLNATIKKAESEPTGDLYAAKNLIDGNLENRYQAPRASKLYGLNKLANEVVIDLGEAKTFDTYTLVGYNNSPAYVMKSWEILVSTDGGSFTALDYQKDNTAKTVSVSFDDVTARYVKIRLFEPDQNKAGMTRLCEFMLFDMNK